MNQSILVEKKPEIIYPDSDGKPMSDNTKQFRYIVIIKENLELLFADNPNVFIAGDLLWYPVEGDNTIRQAPDVMVVFDRPKGDRGSYQQWKENNVTPSVAFEILSPGNTLKEMAKKLAFYEKYGIEEYYIYNPDRNDLNGYLRQDNQLVIIEEMLGFISPLLKIKFELNLEGLQIYDAQGNRFLTYVELSEKIKDTERQLKREKQRAEQERLKAEQEKQRADEAQIRVKLLEEKLKELGIEL
ncbi:Uma2 family endonuclease [Geminocystis sp. CENA526]|uniref:Uma2 family endonuclease n=1 Tax=Geminocystis sp. CENA526 TaxID=1355871 RepID=UPI003D6E9E18